MSSQTENAFYRRGVILGLTMAEVVILIVFCLLLLLNGIVNKKNEALKSITKELEEKNTKILMFTEKHDIVDHLYSFYDELNKNSFDDAFKELLLIKSKVIDLKEELSSLQDANVNARKILNNNKLLKEVVDDLKNKNALFNKNQKSLQKKLEHYKELIALQNKYNISNEEIINIVDVSMSIKEELPGLFEDNEVAIKLINKIALLNQEIEIKDNRLTYLQKKFNIIGKGTEKPACWAEASGKTEYIFEVALTSKGIIIHDNKLPHRAIAQKELPLNAISYDEELSDNVYRRSTKALFDWSEKNGCRFFIKVFDQTKKDEKTIYKKRLRVLGEHFYLYEPLNENPSWITK